MNNKKTTGRTSCCCCSKIRNGALTIAILHLIALGVAVINVSLELDNVMKRQFYYAPSQTSILDPKTALIITLVLIILQLPVSVLFLVGIIKKKPSFVKPWLVISAIGIVVKIGSVICESYKLVNSTRTEPLAVAFAIGFGFFSIGLSIYFWFVIFDYSRTLNKGPGSSSERNKDDGNNHPVNQAQELKDELNEPKVV